MAQGNPYARMVNSMRRQGAYSNNYAMELATVVSRKPLRIRIGEDIITDGIYCNTLTNSDLELEDILKKEELLSEELRQYLKDSFHAFRLDEGDMVLVQRVQNAFYICSKVGKVV